MISIGEIVDILQSLDSHATVDDLVQEYCILHKTLLIPQYRNIMETTLEKNSNIFVYDSNTKIWGIKDKKDIGFSSHENKHINEHKGRTERILKSIVQDVANVEIVTTNKKHTNVNVDGKKAFGIYFRNDSVRVDVHLQGSYYSLAKNLETQGIAYQKKTADPYSSSGLYAFFVSIENETMAYRYLLGLPNSYNGTNLKGFQLFGCYYKSSTFADLTRICMQEIYKKEPLTVEKLANENYKMTETDKIFISKDKSIIRGAAEVIEGTDVYYDVKIDSNSCVRLVKSVLEKCDLYSPKDLIVDVF